MMWIRKIWARLFGKTEMIVTAYPYYKLGDVIKLDHSGLNGLYIVTKVELDQSFTVYTCKKL